MVAARKPNPSRANAGANRDRPAALRSEGPAMRLDITKAGFASEAAVATLEDATADAQTDAAQALSETAALAGAFTGHVADTDPHVGYQKESEKGAANGYASLDAGGKVPSAQLPASAGGGPLGAFAPGSFTVPTGEFRLHGEELELTGTQEGAIEGTGALVVL